MSGETRQRQQIGPYRLLARLGGPTGTVYRAADAGGRDVAIRLLPDAAVPAPRERLGRDLERMREVLSPYAVDVLDGDASADPPYVVSRFVPGRPLIDVVAEHGPLQGANLHRLALGTAKALAAVHEAGLAHGAFGPDTVLVVDGAPVVTDFGIAPHGGDGAAGDVRAWARTVVFAATGGPADTGDAAAALGAGVLPEPLRPLVEAALSADPPSAARLAEAVAALDPGPDSPPPPTVPAPAPAPRTAYSVPPATSGRPRQAAVVRGWARLLSAMVVVLAVGLAIMLPLAGAPVSPAAVAALRRRAAAGPRGVLSALARTAATLPYAAAFALAVGAGLIALSLFGVEADPLGVCAFAVGAGAGALWAAPGVTGPYRRLEQWFAVVARSPRRLAAAGAALGVLAFLAVVGAISLTPSLAPMYGLQTSTESLIARLQAALH
ncbi:protein kinase domain-containing protein [Actinomadura keratinilytica]|uniref:Protein kinase domain-containing protein n=1 Tax=Actinomadura keratinilytica TaxID=547461 RepID=A0ABP7XY64_9ACTN